MESKATRIEPSGPPEPISNVPRIEASVQGKFGRTKFEVPQTWTALKHLGSGAYAAVAAFQDETHSFAVKKAENVFGHPQMALRTLREVRLLAHFRHPNVLAFHGHYFGGSGLDDAYLCVELMDTDLHNLIHVSKDRLTELQVQCTLYQVARGLLCLKSAKVLHRDLKPGNLLVKASGEVKIADLGLSRGYDNHDEDERFTELTEYVVTRYYRAPEIVLTSKHYTSAVDVWSTGCILGEMLKREVLFKGKDSLGEIKVILSVLGKLDQQELEWVPAGNSMRFVMQCMPKAARNGLSQHFSRNEAVREGHSKLNLALDLLEKMVCFNPSRRITVEDILHHPYLHMFQAANDREVVAARCIKPIDWTFDKDLCFDEHGGIRAFEEERFRKVFRESGSFLNRQEECPKVEHDSEATAWAESAGEHHRKSRKPFRLPSSAGAGGGAVGASQRGCSQQGRKTTSGSH